MPISVVRKPPRLSLAELLLFKWVLGGFLALLAIWMVFHVDPDFWMTAGVATVLVLAGLLRPDLPARVPDWVWKGIVPVILVVFLFRLMTADLIPALITLNIWLVVYRTLCPGSRREEMQFLLLCLLLIVVTGVLLVSLLFGLQLLIFTALAMSYLFIVNLAESAAANAEKSEKQWRHLNVFFFFRRFGQVLDFKLVVLGTLLFFTIMGVSTLLFMVIPRVQFDGSISFLDFNRGGSRTGFSANVSLGEVVRITEDTSIALRVDVSPGMALPETPYWRMVVLDEYSRGGMRISASAASTMGLDWDALPIRRHELPVITREQGPTGDAKGRWSFFLEGNVSQFLPYLGTFERLVHRDPGELTANPVLGLYSLRRISGSLTSYQIEGMDFSGRIHDPVLAGGGPLLAQLDPFISMLEEIHDENPRAVAYPQTLLQTFRGRLHQAYLEDLVAEITGGREMTAQEFSRAATRWLASRHSYSLSVTLPQPEGPFRDPVIRWMQHELPGHCEFFAVAFTLLARTAGHPTRVVTGFKGGTWNGFENYFMVRNSDAHAWCEIYDGEGYWIRVDPTPGSDEVGGAPVLMAGGTDHFLADNSMAAYLDSLRMIWYRRIVSFDQSSQVQVMRGVRDFFVRSYQKTVVLLERAGSLFVEWLLRPWDVLRMGYWVLLTLAGTALFYLLQWVWKHAEARLLHSGRFEDPVRNRAGRYLLRLRDMARTAAEPLVIDERLLDDLHRLRYGAADTWPDPAEVFRRVRKAL